MEDCKRVYKVNGKDYLDIRDSSKVVGVPYHSLLALMRGVEFGSSNKFSFKRIRNKILIKKEDLSIVKEAFAV